MAKILVVDDVPVNRELMRAVLAHRGHEVVEAGDGEDALRMAREQRPDLVISDVLMPTMDGYEFVRRLRADKDLTGTQVIFWSAYYLEREARALAEACGVTRIISKPAEPEAILAAVDAVLGIGQTAAPTPEGFDRDHLRVITDQLADKVVRLNAVSGRLSALMDLARGLAVQTDPQLILEGYCNSARDIIGTKFSGIVLADESASTLRLRVTSGVELQGTLRPRPPEADGEALRLLRLVDRPARVGLDRLVVSALGLRSPALSERASYIIVPLVSPSRKYGWLYLAEKLGLEDFSEEDEAVGVALASQLAVAYENALRYEEIQRRSNALEMEVAQRREAERRLAAQYAVSRALAEDGRSAEIGSRVLAILAETLGWEVGALWVLDRSGERLQRVSLWAAEGKGANFEETELAMGRGLAGRVAAEKRALVLAAGGEPRPLGPVPAEAAEGLHYAFPMSFQEQVLGVLEFRGIDRAGLDRDRQRMLVAICNHVGVFLERKRIDKALSRITRARTVMAQCNHVLVHAAEERSLLNNMCQVLVEVGGYRLAWIGLVANGEGAPQMRALAAAGEGVDEFHDPASSVGLAATVHAFSARTVEHGKTQVVREGSAAALEPWYAEARHHGYASAVALPLCKEGKACGALAIFDSVAGAFDEDEVTLLEELADDIAYGVLTLRTRAARHSAEQRLAVQYAVTRVVGECQTLEEAAPRILEAVCGGLRWELGEFWLLDRGSEQLRRRAQWRSLAIRAEQFEALAATSVLKPGQGLAGRVWADGVPLWISDLSRGGTFIAERSAVAGLHSAFGYPIRFEGRLLGVVSFFSKEARRPDEELLGMLAATGEQIGIFIERRRAEAALRETEEKLSDILQSIDNVVWSAAVPGGELLYLNPATERVYGRPVADFYADKSLWTACIHPEDRERLDGLASLLFERGAMTREYRIVRPDGEVRWLEDRVRVAADEDGTPIRLDGAASDITERKRYEARIEYLANHDALTGLPNRNLLGDRIEQTILHASRSGGQFSLLFIDIDRFKFINDSFGHPLGDVMLQEVGKRLAAVIRDGDTVARLGGDEFVLLLPDTGKVDEVAHVAIKVLEATTQPFVLRERELFVTASIGVAVFPEDGRNADVLLRNADTAMYRAKDQGRNGFQFYTRKMGQEARDRVEVEHALRHGLAAGEFELFYQPRVDLRHGQVTGVEALIRWRRGGNGVVLPSAFIPIAEENGLILPLGEWVLRTACTQAQEWVEQVRPDLVMAVNVSARQFRRQNVAHLVARTLDATGLAPEHLELEFTESVLMEETDAFLGMVAELKDMGVTLSLDDFGTGFSSLSYLRRFPLDALKIDQSFVRDLTSSPDSAAIAEAIVAMSRSLKLKAIAEGVETEGQAVWLAGQGCDEIQGYFFAPPMTGADAGALMSEDRRLAALPAHRFVPGRSPGGLH